MSCIRADIPEKWDGSLLPVLSSVRPYKGLATMMPSM
jgi:hypothetical protein